MNFTLGRGERIYNQLLRNTDLINIQLKARLRPMLPLLADSVHPSSRFSTPYTCVKLATLFTKAEGSQVGSTRIPQPHLSLEYLTPRGAFSNWP